LYQHSKHSAKRIRRVTFFGLSGAIILGAIALDYADCDLIDATMFLYFVTFGLSLGCLWMFLDWWWCMARTATRIYVCITALLAAIAYNSGLSIHARSLYLGNHMGDLQALYASNVWQYRVLPELIVLVYLFSFAYARSSVGKDDE
jgi:hypothetical protein